MILETERLVLRNWRDDDKQAYFDLHNDPQVMHFFPAKRSASECEERMAIGMKKCREQGFGWIAMELKSTGACIGISGLMALDYPQATQFARYETGWRIMPNHWGLGLATEAAQAWLGFAFDQLDETAIVATAVSKNTASIAVMKRLGMSQALAGFEHPHIPSSHPHLQPSVLYSITNDQWQTQMRPKS